MAPQTLSQDSARPPLEPNGSCHARAQGQGRAAARYPFVAQHDQTDCGAACLAMIAAFHGIPTSLARLREMANVGRGGSTMWSIAQAGEALGFRTRGLELDAEALPEVQLPALVHLDGCHFAVLYALEKTQVVIGDPARGQVRLSMDEFLRSWTRRALELVPTE